MGSFVSEKTVELIFLRSLEVSAVGLAVCFALHVTGKVHSWPESILGAVAWGLAAFAGEYSRHLMRRRTSRGYMVI